MGVNDREVRFTNIDIFGPQWTNKFGYPFPDSSLGGDSNQFDIAGSFGCLNPSQAVQGAGTIHSVGADYIEVDNATGERSSLYLSSCSRVEGTAKLPKIGQKIAYSGVPAGKSKGSINVYKASCW